MKCPKCQNEINSNAKFCTKCGCNLTVEMANTAGKPVKQLAPVANVCTNCGAPLAAGAKFCVKCGTRVIAKEPEEKTLFLYTDAGSNNKAPSQPNPNWVMPPQGNIVPPEKQDAKKTKPKKVKKEKPPKQPKQPKAPREKEKTSVGLIVVAIILGILVLCSAVLCVLVWNGTISLSEIGKGFATKTEIKGEKNPEDLSEGAEDDGTGKEEINVDELFAQEAEMIETGKTQIATDAEILRGIANLSTAMRQLAAKAEEAGDISLAADRISDAYTSYTTAIIRRKDMLDGQNLSGSIYGQIMIEIDEAIELGEELNEKGCAADVSTLTTMRAEFDKSYTDRMLNTFNEFAFRDNWSRTEAWNLMSGAEDHMFDAEDLDNPIRLRYAYALSWWIQKQIETELNGTITAKGAAIKIANLIEVMDYNPMMVKYYIDYMKNAGESCTDVERAYNDVVNHIYQTQGIKIGTDIPLEHFWYFNDFGTYSVDPVNGVTPENRQWIRARMSSVTFVQQ